MKTIIEFHKNVMKTFNKQIGDKMNKTFSTECFRISADDSIGVIDINGTKMTKEFIEAVSHNKNGYVVKMNGTIFYKKRLLSVISKLFFDFRTVLWALILFGIIMLAMSSFSGCSLIRLISPEDPNQFYKPDTTLQHQIDSTYGGYDLYGGDIVDKDTGKVVNGQKIPPNTGIVFDITYNDSTKKIIDKLKSNVDSLQVLLESMGVAVGKMPELNQQNQKMFFQRYQQLKMKLDSLKSKFTDSSDTFMATKLQDAENAIKKSDSTIAELDSKSQSANKNMLIIGMAVLIIGLVISWIFNKKKPAS